MPANGLTIVYLGGPAQSDLPGEAQRSRERLGWVVRSGSTELAASHDKKQHTNCRIKRNGGVFPVASCSLLTQSP